MTTCHVLLTIESNPLTGFVGEPGSMSVPSIINRAAALPEASSIRIQRIDGGWLIALAGCDIPLACRTLSEVFEAVSLFLGIGQSRKSWKAVSEEPPIGSMCLLSKIDLGYLATIVTPQMNTQIVRFSPMELLHVAAHWTGYAESPSDVRTPKPPPSDENL